MKPSVILSAAVALVVSAFPARAEYDGDWLPIGSGAMFTIVGDMITFEDGKSFRLEFLEKRTSNWGLSDEPAEGAVFRAMMPDGSELPSQWFCDGIAPARYIVLSKTGPNSWVLSTFRGDSRPAGWGNAACTAGAYMRSSKPSPAPLEPTREETRLIQSRLKALGHYTAAVDGITGPGTRRAIRDFQQATGYPVTGELTLEQRTALERQFGERGRPIAGTDPWLGRWGGPNCSADGTIITFSQSQLDLSSFDMQCDIENVGKDGEAYTFHLVCGGEGSTFNTSLSAKADDMTLEFLKQQPGFEFDPKRYVRC